jgi:hypothetical protein
MGASRLQCACKSSTEAGTVFIASSNLAHLSLKKSEPNTPLNESRSKSQRYEETDA